MSWFMSVISGVEKSVANSSFCIALIHKQEERISSQEFFFFFFVIILMQTHWPGN